MENNTIISRRLISVAVIQFGNFTCLSQFIDLSVKMAYAEIQLCQQEHHFYIFFYIYQHRVTCNMSTAYTLNMKSVLLFCQRFNELWFKRLFAAYLRLLCSRHPPNIHSESVRYELWAENRRTTKIYTAESKLWFGTVYKLLQTTLWTMYNFCWYFIYFSRIMMVFTFIFISWTNFNEW